MKKNSVFCAVACFGLAVCSQDVLAAFDTQLTLGVSTSYDYDNRDYEDVFVVDEATGESVQTNTDDDDYERLSLTPSVAILARDATTDLTFRYSPSLKYDLLESQTDLDNSLYAGAVKQLSRAWSITASDSFVHSDYYESNGAISNSSDTGTGETATDSSGNAENADSSGLSSDLGRKRYKRNTLSASTAYIYKPESNISFGADWTALRYDDTTWNDYQDYDRYSVTLGNTHQYSPKWNSRESFSYIRGDYEETGDPASDGYVSSDLDEYRFMAALDNVFSREDLLTLDYNFTGTSYDDEANADSYIHQTQFRWKHDYSRQLYSTAGAGPTYEKVEDQDGSWGGNGILELGYLPTKRSKLVLGALKTYDTDNFSGTNERGVVDAWEGYFRAQHDILQDLSVNGRLSYRFETRTALEGVDANGDVTTSDYDKELYVCGVGLNYSFLRDYSLGLGYTFTKVDSDIVGDDYDDHRILLTLSWQKVVARW